MFMYDKRDCLTGFRRVVAMGGVIALSCPVYAEMQGNRPASQPEEAPAQEMEELVMTIRSKTMRPDTVSSATLTNMKLEEVPQTVNVITTELMEEKGADSMIEAMRMDSSVQTGGDMLLSRTGDQFTIRGFSGSDVQIGNMKVPNGMGYALDTSVIENVEIVKGPIGSISGGQVSPGNAYGAGGSINLMLKKPEFTDRTNLTTTARFLQHGGDKYRVSVDDNFSVGSEDEGFAMRTIVTGELDRPLWLDGGADPGQKYTIAPIFRWQYDSRTKTVWSTVIQHLDGPTSMGVPVLGGQIIGDYNAWYASPNGHTRNNAMLSTVEFEHKADKTWTFRMGGGLGYSDQDYDVRAVSSGGKGMSAIDYYNQMLAGNALFLENAWSDTWSMNWNLYGNALAEFETGAVKHEALMGFSYSGTHTYGYSASIVSNGNENNSGTAYSPYNIPPFIPMEREYVAKNNRDNTLQRLGFIAQDVMSFDGWNVLLGLRGDAHFSLNNTYAFSWSPRLGVSKKIGEHVVLFGNASRTDTPNFGYENEDGKEFTNSYRCEQLEFGARFNPCDKVWLSASWFGIWQNNAPLLDSLTDTYVMEGSKRVEGVELSLTGQITENWSSYISYTYLRQKNRNTGQIANTSSPNSLAIWQKYRIGGGSWDGVTFGAGMRCKDRYYASFRGEKLADNYTIPAYCVFDCSVEVPLPESWMKDASLRFAVYNIFDKEYIQSTRHAVQCTVGEPRTFEISLKATF